MDTSMANYIIQIFRYFPQIVWSWGFNTPVAIPNGLRFKVQGYLHKGWVEVVYDEGYDTFTVRTLNRDGSIKKEVEDVYIDGLVSAIDGMVERCENYKKRVQKQYGFASR
jgi:hypothetical protein